MAVPTALIVESIFALLQLYKSHKDASKITMEQIQSELKRVGEEFEKNKASLLPKVE